MESASVSTSNIKSRLWSLLIAHIPGVLIPIIQGYAAMIAGQLVGTIECFAGSMTVFEDELYLINRNDGKIQIFNILTNKLIESWSCRTPEQEDLEFCRRNPPLSIAVDETRIFIVDPISDCIKVFPREKKEGISRQLLAEWFIEVKYGVLPLWIALDERDMFLAVYDSDTELSSIMVLNKEDGEQVRMLRSERGRGHDVRIVVENKGRHVFLTNSDRYYGSGIEIRDKDELQDDGVMLHVDLPVAVVPYGSQVFVSSTHGMVTFFDRDARQVRQMLTIPAAEGEDYWQPMDMVICHDKLLVSDERNKWIMIFR